jgi:hypothetical protein
MDGPRIPTFRNTIVVLRHPSTTRDPQAGDSISTEPAMTDIRPASPLARRVSMDRFEHLRARIIVVASSTLALAMAAVICLSGGALG